MLSAGLPERPAAKAPGRLSQALIRLLMKRARVTANERLAQHFHLVTLEGAALQNVVWMAGQKIQIAMGSAFTARTYTPIAWNAAAGRACILGYAHGEGPGSAWLRAAAPDGICDIFGPRASLDVDHMAGPLALFGDETSIGLAHALAHHDPDRRVTGCLEVGDVVSCGAVLAQLGLDDIALVRRDGEDAHLAEVEQNLAAAVVTGASFVLTGKAGTIQRLRRKLKALGVPANRIVTKAYWAPGKTGLD